MTEPPVFDVDAIRADVVRAHVTGLFDRPVDDFADDIADSVVESHAVAECIRRIVMFKGNVHVSEIVSATRQLAEAVVAYLTYRDEDQIEHMVDLHLEKLRETDRGLS